MRIKALAVTLLLTFIGALSVSCSDKNSPNDSERGTNMDVKNTYTASSDNVKALGRTYFSNDLLRCAFSGTGAEFTFTGTKCQVAIEGDSISEVENNDDNYARVGIFVNGERVIDDMINEKDKLYTVFESDTEQEVVVRIVKLSETAMSTFSIKEIGVNGSQITPTKNNDTFIEIIGDSITCGYGVDADDKNTPFSTQTEDVTKAYSYKTVQNLGADYSMVSISGYGIISGFTNGDTKVSSQTIPQYYDKMGFSYGTFGAKRPNNIDWDFNRLPDLIVINLGTNDDSYTKTDKDKQAEYQAGYVEFLQTIRSHNPDAKILCTLGIMGDRLFPQVEAAVAEYSALTGDNEVYTMKFDVQLQSDGYGADWHPSIATHDKAAEKLTQKIEELLS